MKDLKICVSRSINYIITSVTEKWHLCDSRKIHYLTLEFHVKLHLKTDIALIASRFVRNSLIR